MRASFPMFKCSKKCTFSFLLYAPVCITNMVEFQKAMHCKDCVWPIILVAALYTTCPGERVLVVMTQQVQYNIPTFEALLRKNRSATCFSIDAEGLITYNCMLWRSQIVYIHPYSLNTTTAFYFVTECSNIAVFVRLRVCMSQCIRTLPGLDQFRN